MKRIINLLKENVIFIVILIVMFIVMSFPLPYYIDGPGGLTNIDKRYKIENEYKSKGTINMTYVSEYKATVASFLVAKLNKNLDIYKKTTILPENSNEKEEELRGKIMFEEALDSALIVAYKYSNSDIKINKEKVLVTYIYKKANTNLKVGDQIIKIDDVNVSSLKQLKNILENKKQNKKITLNVINNKKEYKRFAYVDNKKKINILINSNYELSLNPKIKIKYESNEYGSSGGLMNTLSIYNKLTKEDITNGLTISGTGTIDVDGKVGEVDGIKYKLSGAVKKKADIFLVPSNNYKEAIKYKNKNHYKIKIIKVNTFKDALDKLKRE